MKRKLVIGTIILTVFLSACGNVSLDLEKDTDNSSTEVVSNEQETVLEEKKIKKVKMLRK